MVDINGVGYQVGIDESPLVVFFDDLLKIFLVFVLCEIGAFQETAFSIAHLLNDVRCVDTDIAG